MNKKHLSRMGLLGEQFIERPYSEFHSPKETKVFIEKVDKIFETGKSAQYEYKSFRDNRYFFQTFSPVKDSAGQTIAVTVLSKEITKLKEVEEKLRTLSFTDELTGLYNRRGFFALAEQQIKLANRDKKGRFLFSADLDNLKEINDTYGHKEGDLVLLETAIILKKSFRESDIIARIGGDEFVILTMDTPETNIEMLTGRLKSHLEAHNTSSKKPYKLSLSLGLTFYNPEKPCSVDDILSHADHLMYEEKKRKQQNIRG
jgi:diguanylate cyclase (GGDEF)-like protein